jgi:hypothetical protein
MRCPFVGCTSEIFEQDVQRLVQANALTPEDSGRFAELRSRDYSARAQMLTGELIESASEKDLESIKRIWQTMRFCPRCNLAIERSHGCNSFYCICGNHFDFATAPRVVGNGVENFNKAIEVAKTLGVPLAVAESFGKDSDSPNKKWSAGRALALHREVTKIATETGTEFEEAWRLQQQARNGDEEARAKIRAGKHRTSTDANRHAEEEDEEECFMLGWDSPGPDTEAEEVETHDEPVADKNLFEEEMNALQDTNGYVQGSFLNTNAKEISALVLLCPEVFHANSTMNVTDIKEFEHTER